MFAKQLYFGLSVATIAGFAHAGASNPLHPSYYWNGVPAVQVAPSGAPLYVDNRNPLHPAFARFTGDAGWQSAVGSTSGGYRNSNNPLHPSFKR